MFQLQVNVSYLLDTRVTEKGNENENERSPVTLDDADDMFDRFIL